MARIGRNDPCPCGSGKKYKHCCYGEKSHAPTPVPLHGEDQDWFKMRRTEGELVGHVLDFFAEEYGEYVIGEAMDEFLCWGEFEIDQLSLENFFIPWFVFNWLPGEREEKRAGRARYELPLGLQYLKKNIRRLDDYQQAFIVAACAQPFSFFAITEVVPGKSMGLRDLFIDRTFTVKEAQASRILRRGDTIYGRVVSLDDQAIVVGMAPVLIPPRNQADILDVRDGLKKRLRKSGHEFEFDLHALTLADFQLRRVYFALADRISNPAPPILQNTDGDPLTFVKLYFDLNCSPQEALEGLKSLALPEFQPALLEDSVDDAQGKLLEFSFDWQRKGNKAHKHWDNTILGHISVKGNTLIAEVNSEKRAKKIRSEITKKLGQNATYKRSLYESAEQKLKEMEEQPPDDDSQREMEEFQSLPEVRAELEKQMKDHWEAWYREKIPALNNKTPVEAARTAAGRERLEALLCDFERSNESVSQPFLQIDVAAMRKKLGL